MSDPSLIFKLIQPFFSAWLKSVAKPWHKAKILLFRFRNSRSPLTETRAKQIATSILGGDVPIAISFRSMDTVHVRIAVLRRPSERNFDSKVFLLEQLGTTFQVIWKSEALFSFTGSQLEVQDVNVDGNREVIYEDNNYGTGGAFRSLHVYFPECKKLRSLTESLNWQNFSGPAAATVTIDAEGADSNLIKQIETLVLNRGFLQEGPIVDFEKSEFAAQRWHKENGKFPQAKIKIHYYKGLPQFQSNVVATLSSSDRVWISLFKGLLIEYDVANDRHYVVYSPASFYNWVNCMSYDGDRLWCGVHGMGGLISYEPITRILIKYDKFQEQDLPEVCTICGEGGLLVLNGTMKIPASGL